MFGFFIEFNEFGNDFVFNIFKFLIGVSAMVTD